MFTISVSMAVVIFVSVLGYFVLRDDKHYIGDVYVYNWGEYIDPEVIAMFEEETGYKVHYEEFETNEEMYTKLLGGESFDILVPSDYMIERLMQEEMLQPIKQDYITNKDQLSQTVLDLGHTYDPTGAYFG